MTFNDGDAYQKRFDDLAASGVDVHGEAEFVVRYAPRTVLDAGCGTGRVAIELARRDIDVVGVDVAAALLEKARALAPDLEWIEHDLTTLDLGRTFAVVVMAGNVPLFTPAGTHRALVAGCSRHVAPDGVLIAGFQLDRGYSLGQYDDDCAAAGLTLVDRYASWAAQPFVEGGDYAVSAHRPAVS
jgi:SAM-dependent methyltransferase